MRLFHRRPRGALIAVLAVLASIAVAAGCGDDEPPTAAATADGSGFTLAATDDAAGAERAVAYLRQDDDRLRGWIVAWGLEPGSAHAAHLHANAPGEDEAACSGARTTRHAVEFGDLVAGADGVASHRVDMLAGEDVVRPGAYVMIHAHGMAAGGGPAMGGDNPGILCGDIIPAGRSS